MKPLGVKFSDSAELQIKDIAETLGVRTSVAARAALALGAQKLKAISSKDIAKAQELALIEDLKARQ